MIDLFDESGTGSPRLFVCYLFYIFITAVLLIAVWIFLIHFFLSEKAKTFHIFCDIIPQSLPQMFRLSSAVPSVSSLHIELV